MVAAAVFSALVLAGLGSTALPPVSIKGTKFFLEDGTQFFMKGVAYQQDTSGAGGETKAKTFLDPLADEKKCERDIPLLAECGTNVIRVYAIDPEADHSACMKLLDENGIYVVADLSNPQESINRNDPVWNTELYARYTAVVDALEPYSNTIGFFAGNEVTNNDNNTDASAFVKAAIRDTKKYIKNKEYRSMGVGYAANDDEEIRIQLSNYFSCGKKSESMDFFGYNIYSWCGKSSMSKSGYDKQVDFFKSYNIPVFFAEYGCNTQGGAEGRVWDETTALYSDEMTGVFSGGIVYMYFQETNDYGIVEIDDDGKANKMKNFEKLKEKVLEADPKGVKKSDYNPERSDMKCPAVGDGWESHEVLPPTPDTKLCECMQKSLSCRVKDKTNKKEFGEIFGLACTDSKVCAGISTNTKLGRFGKYSMCTSEQQLDFAVDAYYKSQDSDASACDFDGLAEVVDSEEDSSCTEMLEEAEKANQEVASATDAAKPSEEDEDDDDDESSAFRPTIFAGVYAVIALLSGVFVVFL